MGEVCFGEFADLFGELKCLGEAFEDFAARGVMASDMNSRARHSLPLLALVGEIGE